MYLHSFESKQVEKRRKKYSNASQWMDTAFHEHGQTRLLYRWVKSLKCIVIEDTHDGSTGVLVLVLLVGVITLRSTMFHLKDLYI